MPLGPPSLHTLCALHGTGHRVIHLATANANREQNSPSMRMGVSSAPRRAPESPLPRAAAGPRVGGSRSWPALHRCQSGPPPRSPSTLHRQPRGRHCRVVSSVARARGRWPANKGLQPWPRVPDSARLQCSPKSYTAPQAPGDAVARGPHGERLGEKSEGRTGPPPLLPPPRGPSSLLFLKGSRAGPARPRLHDQRQVFQKETSVGRRWPPAGG